MTTGDRSHRIRNDPPGHRTATAQERTRAWRHHDALAGQPEHAALLARIDAAEVELAAARLALADAVPTRSCERCAGAGRICFAPLPGLPSVLSCPPCAGTGRVIGGP